MPSKVQIMDYRSFSTKPLSDPIRIQAIVGTNSDSRNYLPVKLELNFFI